MVSQVLAVLLLVTATHAQSTLQSTGGTLPQKPAGQPASLAEHFTTTAGQKYDSFSGISYKQLDVVRTQWSIVKQRAAQASNVDASQGARIFGKQTDFLYALWFQGNALQFRLPINTNNPDGGGQGSVNITEAYWQNEEADRVDGGYGRAIDRLISHLLAYDPVGYHRVADDRAYFEYLQGQINGKPSATDPILSYLNDPIHLTTAVNFFLGSDFTPEIQSAFQTVFRFISWHLGVVVNMYNSKVYLRYEGQGSVDSACNPNNPQDLAPAEEDYPFTSSGTVTPDGKHSSRNKLGRSDNYPGSDSSTSTPSSATSGLPAQPKPSPGAPSMTPFPYSATADKPTDQFSGITIDQLAVGSATWARVKLAAAKATSVPDSEGDIAFLKQAYYVMVQRHPEFLPAFNITNAEEIWASTEFDARIREPYARKLDFIIVGMTTNNYPLTIRSLDRSQFQHYLESKELGQAWYSLTYSAWVTDAALSAAEFFLGSSLTDEQYAALESIFNFAYLKAYQVYHDYNKGYRVRPFASDFEMVGSVSM